MRTWRRVQVDEWLQNKHVLLSINSEVAEGYAATLEDSCEFERLSR